MCVCIHVYVHTSMCVCAYMHVCVHTCMCVFVYVVVGASEGLAEIVVHTA